MEVVFKNSFGKKILKQFWLIFHFGPYKLSVVQLSLEVLFQLINGMNLHFVYVGQIDARGRKLFRVWNFALYAELNTPNKVMSHTSLSTISTSCISLTNICVEWKFRLVEIKF